MSIYENVMNNRKDKNADRSLLALIASEICIDGKPMDDTAAIVRLNQMRKTCMKNIDIYQAAGQDEKVKEEVVFANMIASYMPVPATKDDIVSAITHLGVDKNVKSMGKVMKFLGQTFTVVDGALVKSVLMGEA